MRSFVKVVSILVFIFLFIKIFFPYYRVQTTSMEPTIKKGQIIIVNRFQYAISTPQMNDIVLFKPLEEVFEKGEWMHRIIGVEGNRVTIENGKVLVDDKLAQFPDIEKSENMEMIVPEGNIFQKGDNVKTIYGLLPVNAIKGKVIFSF